MGTFPIELICGGIYCLTRTYAGCRSFRVYSVKGGIILSAHGTIVARVFTSNAMLPLSGASVAITRRSADGRTELVAFRITNYDGLTEPVEIDTPELDGSTLSSSGTQPYARIDLAVDLPGYDRILVTGAQVFTDTQTVQELMLLPTPSLPEQYDRTQTISIPAQTL